MFVYSKMNKLYVLAKIFIKNKKPLLDVTDHVALVIEC